MSSFHVVLSFAEYWMCLFLYSKHFTKLSKSDFVFATLGAFRVMFNRERAAVLLCFHVEMFSKGVCGWW